MARGDFDDWAPYVPVAQRRQQAGRKAAELKKKGQVCAPVHIAGRKIALSFWGQAWCDNLEAYSDYANRLPRGRTYVRNGSVVHLEVGPGNIKSLVSGSSVYRVEIDVHPLETARWTAIVQACAGQVASLIEVLQGRISKAVMTVVTDRAKGLFPTPRQMRFSCSCPDSASMCKHVAATLYGVGARLDDQPELLFTLRHVAASDLIQQGVGLPPATAGRAAAPDILEGADLADLFGIEMGEAPAPAVPGSKPVAPQVAGSKAGTRIDAATLIARGIPRHMIQAWRIAGVLKDGPKPGLYRSTRQTEARIQAYLARGGT